MLDFPLLHVHLKNNACNSIFKWHYNLRCQFRDAQDVTCQALIQLLLHCFSPRMDCSSRTLD